MTNLIRRPMVLATGAALLLAACDNPVDYDLRSQLGTGPFSTTAAAQNLPGRPAADSRGVISYPTYQVAVAREGDSVQQVADRLGLPAGELARYNGLSPDTVLRRDELLALPSRVSEPLVASGAALGNDEVDVTSLAATAIDRAGPQQTTTRASTVSPAATASVAASGGIEPIRHQVTSGETIYTVSRLYNVPVRVIADWNTLGSDLSIREGQFLLIPQSLATGATPEPAATAAPGTGSATPVPPSASTPLPEETAAAAPAAAPATPNLGTGAAPVSDAPLIMPVRGSIVRGYAAGTNEGIDISATAGAEVKAAAAGTVAAITRDTNNIAIVVIRHATDLLTVYTNLENLKISEGQTVTQGQAIGQVKAGNPAIIHFEVRLSGMKSADPEDYLP